MTAATLPASPLRDVPRERSSLWEWVARSQLPSVVVGASKDANAKITILLVAPDGTPAFAIKAATTAAASRAIEAEARALAGVHELDPTGVAGTVPRVVDALELGGRPALVMSAVPGVSMSTRYLRWRHTARPARVRDDFAAAGSWLDTFQQRTADGEGPLEMDAGVQRRLTTRFADDPRLRDDGEALAAIHGRLRTETVARTAVHGDFWFGNVLRDGPDVSGVVDWEAGCTTGEPVRDLVRFAHMYALYLDRRTRAGGRVAGHAGLRADGWGAALRYALEGSGWFPGLFRGFLKQGLARLGASPAVWRDAALAGVAEVAALTDDDAFARRHLELFRQLTRPGRSVR